MSEANKEHYADIDPYDRKLTLKHRGSTIVQSRNALILKEVRKKVYDPVFYFPKDDLETELEKVPDMQSRCPIKGEALYWNLKDPVEDYFAWSYEDPTSEAKEIEGYIAFNPDYVTIISEPLDTKN